VRSGARLPGGVAQTVERLSRRELSAEALLRECLLRIRAREPAVQAWELVDEEGALREARRIDALEHRPPLCGLPVGIKDLIDTSDLPTAYGSSLYRGHRPIADAACVRLLRQAGAVVVGKTVTTEFAVYTPGKTRNPRDLSRTPGGSSSGSAAAVADGMVPLALGTQTAASVIRPASFCGVIGWKPSFGALPLAGVHALAPSLDTLGFFVRELADVRVVMAALGAPLPEHARAPSLALCRTGTWDRAEPSTRRALEDAAARLGAREVMLGPSFDGLVEAQLAIMAAEAAVSLRAELERGPEHLSPRLRALLAEGRSITPERLREAHAQGATCRAELQEIFKSVDALFTPAAAGEAPIGLEATGDPLFSRIWTLLGNPAVSLPLIEGPAGMPLGLQLIGPAAGESRLLAAAELVTRTLQP
jgi:Asp-tRNA(Asn)/Glu-tRNA(Gln) amidotransferase A subunit family amidase